MLFQFVRFVIVLSTVQSEDIPEYPRPANPVLNEDPYGGSDGQDVEYHPYCAHGSCVLNSSLMPPSDPSRFVASYGRNTVFALSPAASCCIIWMYFCARI